LGTPFASIATGIISSGNSIISKIGDISSFLGGAINAVKDKIGEIGISLGTAYINQILSVKDAIVSIGTTIIDGVKGVFSWAWIPSDTFFMDLYGGLYNDLTAKFPILDQMKNMITDFYELISNASAVPPSFDIVYKGSTVSIIDLSMYDQYRSFIHGIILAIAYFLFGRKILKRLPGLIGGFSN